MHNKHISLVHSTGNPYSRNVAIALAEAGLLYEIITTIAYNPKGFLERCLKIIPHKVRRYISYELERRIWRAPLDKTISTHLCNEIIREAFIQSGLCRKLGLNPQSLSSIVQLLLDRHVAKCHLKGINAVYAYEDEAACTFQAAKQRGIICLYDLPIVFYRVSRDIETEEAERFPDLASSLQATREPRWKIERKEKEVQLADHIFVPSLFVKKSLLDTGVMPEKISVVSYGAPTDYFSPKEKTNGLFRALFVGRVGPRKGVHYLLEAWQELKLRNAELLLIGVNEFPRKWLSKYKEIFKYIPSMPHIALSQFYGAASILVLPSLVEGCALVVLEAMASGIPVITTHNSVDPGIVTDGVEGFVVPIRDVEALKEKLSWCHSHPKELAEMGRAARTKAEKLTWALYRLKLSNKVREILYNKK